MTTPQKREAARDRGERRKERGIERAAFGNHRAIVETQLAILNAIATATDGRATSDDAAGDHIGRRYADGGRWRGAAVRELAADGLIRRDGATQSDRASRHRGLLTVWAAVDRTAIERRRTSLRRMIDDWRDDPPIAAIDVSTPPTNEPGDAMAVASPGNSEFTSS